LHGYGRQWCRRIQDALNQVQKRFPCLALFHFNLLISVHARLAYHLLQRHLHQLRRVRAARTHARCCLPLLAYRFLGAKVVTGKQELGLRGRHHHGADGTHAQACFNITLEALDVGKQQALVRHPILHAHAILLVKRRSRRRALEQIQVLRDAGGHALQAIVACLRQ
jgi:hypothetical protein